jgi:peptidoglycan/xylan/chitin deacetylase (PgdA/CDA1 family)
LLAPTPAATFGDPTGVDGTPYFRTPYGVHNADIDRVNADQGYTTVTMWSGDLLDWLHEKETALIANAAKFFQPQQIVLTHATITHRYSQLLDLIHSRNPQTVTLNDVFA